VLNVFDAAGRRAFRLTGRLRGFDELARLVQARAPLAARTAPSWWEQYIAYA